MTEQLTGNFRFRPLNRFRDRPLMVLQVEVSFPDGVDDWHGMPSYIAGIKWRDARVEDNICVTCATTKDSTC